MSCQSGFCWESFTDLCANVGQTCITIETVFSGLIENQFALASAIAPVISDVSGYPTCTRVYYDTVAGAYTNTSNANTVSIGIHLFGGRVALDGQGSCVTVNCTPGTLPSTGDYLDDDLCVTENPGEAAFILLEDATNSGCTFATTIPGNRDVEWSYISRDQGIGIIVPSNIVTLATVDSVVVPYDGFYQINFEAYAQTPVVGVLPAGAGPTYISIRADVSSVDTRYADQTSSVNDSLFEVMSASSGLCLSAGDTVYVTIAQSATAAGLRPSTVTGDDFSVVYVGPGGC